MIKTISWFLYLTVLPLVGITQVVSKDSIEHTIVSKEGKLSDTLFAPLQSKKGPVVLIIAGSGPTDRNGNSTQLPGKNNSLLQLADSLVKNGIAVLRYDKRGIGKSQFPGDRKSTRLNSSH